MKWSEVQEQGLKKMAEQCRGLQWLHMRTSDLIRRDMVRYKIALTLLILATFILTVLDDIKTDVVLSIFRQITLFLSQLCVLYKLFVGDEKMEVTYEHVTRSKEYMNLSLTIENELRKSRVDRDRAANFIKRIESEYRRILNNTLDIHQRAIDEFNAINKNTRAAVPIVVGGVEEVLVNDAAEEREVIMPKSYTVDAV